MGKFSSRMKMTGVALVLILSVCVAACSTGGNENASLPETPGISQQEPNSGTSEPSAKQPVTLTIWNMMGYGVNFPSGIQEDPVAKEVERVTGVTMDVEFNSTDHDKFKVLLASGDLPDIAIVPQSYAAQIVEGGLAVDLEPLIRQHGADWASNIPNSLNYSKTYLGGDNLFFIPMNEGPGSPYPDTLPYIRWDYYKELEYPTVTSDDDLLNLVAEMLKRHPVNEDGQQFYGFSPFFDWGPTFATGVAGAGHATGKNSTDNTLAEYRMETDSFHNFLLNTDSAVWQGLEFYNKANRMGLLDPDALTQKYDNAAEKAGSNRVLSVNVDWISDPANKLLAQAGFEDRGYMPLPPYGEYFLGGRNLPNGENNKLLFISSSSQYPERAMDFINYMMSVEGSRTFYNGVQGQTFVEKDGKYMFTPEHLEMEKSDPNVVQKTGAGKYWHLAGVGTYVTDDRGQAIALNFDRDNMLVKQQTNQSPLEKDYTSYYGIDFRNDIVAKFATKGSLSNSIAETLAGEIPDDMKRKVDQILNYYNANFAKLILAESEEQFRQLQTNMIDEMKSRMELEAVAQYFDQYYQGAQAKERALRNP